MQGGPAVPAPERRSTSTWLRRAAIGVVLAGAAAALAFLTSPAGPTSVRQLPGEQRAALVERTRANLRDLCRGAERPREFCREQASILLALPECGEACRADARDELLADTAVR